MLLCSTIYADDNPVYIYGNLGIGAYSRDMGNPEITTPNMLGDIELGIGVEYSNNVDLKFGIEHWSSLQGFPNIFNSPDEDGRGFNAIWIKVEKKLYIK